MAAPQKPKLCKKKIRSGSKLIDCDNQLNGTELCSKRDMHMLPFKTGFCGNGWCEGLKAHSKDGNPVPTCKFYMTCPCNCHQMLWTMFEMSDMERVLVEKSEYHTPERAFWMPSDDPEYWATARSSDNGAPVPVLVQSPIPDAVPATVRRSYAPTATGRAARGELESWVKDACDVWLVEGYDFYCTPVWLSEEIAITQAIKAPSVGAISAVFERWSKLGFASIEKKPTRFIKYTDQGVKLGLEQMKARSKRQVKLVDAEKKRNLIR